jgi:hypothetical protein
MYLIFPLGVEALLVGDLMSSHGQGSESAYQHNPRIKLEQNACNFFLRTYTACKMPVFYQGHLFFSSISKGDLRF